MSATPSPTEQPKTAAEVASERRENRLHSLRNWIAFYVGLESFLFVSILFRIARKTTDVTSSLATSVFDGTMSMVSVGTFVIIAVRLVYVSLNYSEVRAEKP